MSPLSQILALSTLLFSAHSLADCLKDGEQLALSGAVSRETFPGPPNYESIDDGDSPETFWILTVNTPQCVMAQSMKNSGFYEVATATKRFQLAFKNSDVYKTPKNIVHNSVVIEGQLFLGVSGHHHTKALISVENINPAIH